MSNFTIENLEAIITATGVIPVSRTKATSNAPCSDLNYDTGSDPNRGTSAFASG